MRSINLNSILKNTKTLSLYSFLLLILCSFLIKDEKNIIVWQENKPLTWNDFRGKPEKRFSAASTHYDIFKTTEQNGPSAEVVIEAVFFCNKSWKKESWINQQVLEHEQKHFDIVELFARKLRKMTQEKTYYSYSYLKSASDSLYTVIDKEMDVYQDKYDDETNASMNGDKQREWNKKIIAELEAFSEYKSTVFTVLFSK